MQTKAKTARPGAERKRPDRKPKKQAPARKTGPQIAQQTIPYREIFKDGICRVNDRLYTKSMEYEDINYQLAQADDQSAIFDGYCAFLNSFDSSLPFQLSFINHRSRPESKYKLNIPMKEDGYSDMRSEYVEMLKGQIAKSNNGIVRTKLLTFGVSADSLAAARPRLTARDLARLGYDAAQSARITRLLAREAQLEQYLRAAAAQGITAVTRLSSQYPARLRHTLGPRCPAVLFAKGEAELLSARCISVVGSRELSGEGRAFAAEAGRRIAAEGFALCSGGAAGADRAAQDACLAHGGSAVIFPAGRLTDCPAQEHVLYLAEQAYDAPFSTPRALGRNYLIHAMGEKTLVAQCRAGSGGTWDGTTENLKHGWSPVFVHDDGTPGAGALIERGAAAVRALGRLDELQPEQLHF